MVSACHTPSRFYPYVMYVINFTRLPHFSVCNIEKLRESGDEARRTVQCSASKMQIAHIYTCTTCSSHFSLTSSFRNSWAADAESFLSISVVALSRAELVANPSLSARRCSTCLGRGGGGGRARCIHMYVGTVLCWYSAYSLSP